MVKLNMNHLKVNNIFLLVVLLPIILGGCSGVSIPLAPADRQMIKSISIDPSDIVFSTNNNAVLFNTSARAWSAGLGGIVGSLAYEKMHNRTPEETILFLFHKDRMVENTVSEAYEFQFEQSKMFKLSTKKEAEAYLEIEVTSIQFHELNGNNLKMAGDQKAKLVSAIDGRILWESSERFSAFNSKILEYPMEEYISDPSKLKYALSVLSQMHAREFVTSLGGSPVPVSHSLYENTKKKLVDQDLRITRPANENTNNSELETKLLGLKKMYEEGLIEKEEYNSKRQQLINEF